MCDEFTRLAEDAAFSRRDFTVLGGAALLAGCAGGSGLGGSAAELTERTVTMQTGDGIADGFFVHPVKGKHPAVLIWPDIAGLRDVYKVMARRLAGDGFAVLVVNQYYRNAPAPVLSGFAEWRTPEGQAKMKPMIAAITPDATMRDAAAFVAFLDREEAVSRKRRIGTAGYCMGGPFTVRAAAAVPARIGAAASFHGAALVTDKPDSPHLLLPRTRASYLIAIGQNDDARAPGDKDVLRKAAADARRPAEIEVYPADHGWCVADTPIYNAEQAERAWNRMLVLFAKL